MNAVTIEQLESRGYRIVTDGSGVIVISGKGRNVRAYRYPSPEVAVRTLIDVFPLERKPLRSLTEVASEAEEV